jgi:hypothetical protein
MLSQQTAWMCLWVLMSFKYTSFCCKHLGGSPFYRWLVGRAGQSFIEIGSFAVCTTRVLSLRVTWYNLAYCASIEQQGSARVMDNDSTERMMSLSSVFI